MDSMAQVRSRQKRASSALAALKRSDAPLFVVGGFAAVIVSERLQLWQSGQGMVAVVLLLTLPLVCAGLGALGGRWLADLDGALAFRLLWGVLFLLGGWGFLVAQTASWVVVVEAGLLVLLLAPPLLVLTLLALRPPARAGSLLARASERVRWGVVGGVACGGTLLALPDWYGLREFYRSSTLVVWAAVGVALLTLGACVLSSARDLRRARRACREEASLQPVAAGHVAPGTRLLDIGVGNRMLGEVTSGDSAYRACDRVASVVVGDPGLGASRLARAHRRLVWGCAAAMLSVGVGAIGSIGSTIGPHVAQASAAGPGIGDAWRRAGQEPLQRAEPGNREPRGPEPGEPEPGEREPGEREPGELEPEKPVSERVPGSPGLGTFTPP